MDFIEHHSFPCSPAVIQLVPLFTCVCDPTPLRAQFTATGEHYNDVMMDAIASQITSLTIVYSIVYSDAGQRKHQSSASLAFVRGIHRGPVNSPHKWPVTRKMFPFDDVMFFPPTDFFSSIYSSVELFMRAQKVYFGVYYPSCAAAREINTKITLG